MPEASVTPINQLVNTELASYHTGLTVAAIRKWVQRGQLPVAARDWRGRPLFRVWDIIEAERSTRKGAGRSHTKRLAQVWDDAMTESAAA